MTRYLRFAFRHPYLLAALVVVLFLPWIWMSFLVPRWAMHQTQNLGASEMRFLAVTDFQLSQRALVGDATDYRMNTDIDGRSRH